LRPVSSSIVSVKLGHHVCWKSWRITTTIRSSNA
jgi:hypothetical protein